METWLDQICRHLRNTDLHPIVGLARGMVHHNPDRFREHHPDLETVEIDGRGLTGEGRSRALTRCIKKVKPLIALPLSLVEANQAVARCKATGQDTRLVIHAQGNLPPMLADLKHFRPIIDHVVCPGRLTRQVLCTWGSFDQSDVSHIPNGALSRRFERRENPDGRLRIGYVGRFSQQDKRVLDIIPLVNQLREKGLRFSFKIAGTGGEEAKLRSALQGFPEVSFCGALSQEQLYRDFYPDLDVLVLFSSSEAFGIVLAEAMMNGVVPVTSQFTGYHSEKLVLEEVTGLSFPVGDIEKAAIQLDRLQNDPVFRKRLSDKGQQHAEANYRWNSSLKLWEECLRRVMHGPVRVSANCGESLWPDPAGRLNRLGIPEAIIDLFRRMRRKLLGPAVPAGGTEWPLHNIHYAESELNEITAACERAEAIAKNATEAS